MCCELLCWAVIQIPQVGGSISRDISRSFSKPRFLLISSLSASGTQVRESIGERECRLGRYQELCSVGACQTLDSGCRREASLAQEYLERRFQTAAAASFWRLSDNDSQPHVGPAQVTKSSRACPQGLQTSPDPDQKLISSWRAARSMGTA